MEADEGIADMELYTTIATVAISMIATLTGKYIWDRYMSKSSRVTVKDHERDIAGLEKRLAAGSDTFKKINTCMSAMCMVQLELCEKLKVDCGDIRKIIIDSGLDL